MAKTGDPHALVWIRVDDVNDLKCVIDRLRHTSNGFGTKTLMVPGTWRPTRQRPG